MTGCAALHFVELHSRNQDLVSRRNIYHRPGASTALSLAALASHWVSVTAAPRRLLAMAARAACSAGALCTTILPPCRACVKCFASEMCDLWSPVTRELGMFPAVLHVGGTAYL